MRVWRFSRHGKSITHRENGKAQPDFHRYRIAGDYICEVMTGFPVFDSNPRSMFLRLQVPVRFRK